MRLHCWKCLPLLAVAALAGNAFCAVEAPAAADSSRAKSAEDSSRGNVLDKGRIHGYYSEGSFEAVIGGLEDFLKRNRAYTRDDSIFIFKHLGVVHAANTATREKGRYYMVRLLETDSTANLDDMYVGDEIQGVFAKVKAEFQLREAGLASRRARQAEPGPSESPGRETPRAEAPGSEKAPAIGRSSHAGFWIAAGTGLVATGAVTYYLLESQRNTAKETIYDVTPPQ